MLAATDATVWRPSEAQVDSALVTTLVRAFGLDDYGALHRFSLERPDDYWMRMIDELGIVWSRRPDAYARFDRGPEFPDWFPGGELNWTDTVFSRGHDDVAGAVRAIVAEREDGDVRSLTYRELAELVGRFAAGLRGLGVGRGDRVGLIMESGIEATASLLAIARVGAIVVPLFSGFGADAVVSRLLPSEVGLLIASTGFERRGRRVNLVGAVSEAAGRLPGCNG